MIGPPISTAIIPSSNIPKITLLEPPIEFKAFLGALVAGSAAGYLMKGLRKLFDYLPDTFEGLKPVLLYPFFGLLLMALLMTFIINPPVAKAPKNPEFP